MLLIVTLRRGRGWLVHIVPASVVVRLPARPGVFVHVAVVSGIHVAVGGLSRSRIAIGSAGGHALATLRGLDGSGRSIRIGGMLGISRVAILADHRLSPRPI